MLRILLADDHAVVREGIRSLLERHGLTVVAEASSGLDAVRLAGSCGADVVVLDVAMPGLNGLDAARAILKRVPHVRVVLLTMHTEGGYVVEALKAGVKAYVLKTEAGSDLLQAIRASVAGGTYVSPGVSDSVVEAVEFGGAAGAALTPRERQVLQLVAEGHTTKEVASLLGISVKTADSHRTHVMRKLDVHETAGLVRTAVRMGLIQA